ncbi:MAG: nicotinamidase [Chloroflexota bacterium]
MPIGEHDGLIIVDVQNDFCPGGALGVPTGEEVAATLSRVAAHFAAHGALVFATQDWHPAGHASFKAQRGPWPEHCVQGTPGAEFHPALTLPVDAQVVRKGADPARDAYSGFVDSDLEKRLRTAGVTRVFIGGLATDYCVLNTVVDAVDNGFETYVLLDAVGAVDVEPGDGQRALHLMAGSGAGLVEASAILAEGQD